MSENEIFLAQSKIVLRHRDWLAALFSGSNSVLKWCIWERSEASKLVVVRNNTDHPFETMDWVQKCLTDLHSALSCRTDCLYYVMADWL